MVGREQRWFHLSPLGCEIQTAFAFTGWLVQGHTTLGVSARAPLSRHACFSTVPTLLQDQGQATLQWMLFPRNYVWPFYTCWAKPLISAWGLPTSFS